MRRRQFLGLVTGFVTVAGCLDAAGEDTASDRGSDATATPQQTPTPTSVSEPTPGVTSVDGVDLPVPVSEMRQALPRDYIPAIVEPAFATDWSGLDADGRDPTLPADTPVLGLERDGSARAYPLRILDHHEVVNDTFDGPVAVTYCVLCGSGVVVERRVDGHPTTLGVSGKLWRSDLVMYDDRTESLWSQLLATAINGPRTGEQLTILPSSLTTWGEWQSTHPETRVLLPPPHSDTLGTYDRSFDYFSPKYSRADESQLVGRDSYDGDLHPKTMVLGITTDDVARAYPFDAVTAKDVVVDRVGEVPVVVAAAPDGTLVAYDRRVDGETLSFEGHDDQHIAGGNSRWERTTGRAVDGPFAGQRLERANEHPPMFWLGWSKFNPGTDVYGRDE